MKQNKTCLETVAQFDLDVIASGFPPQKTRRDELCFVAAGCTFAACMRDAIALARLAARFGWAA